VNHLCAAGNSGLEPASLFAVMKSGFSGVKAWSRKSFRLREVNGPGMEGTGLKVLEPLVVQYRRRSDMDVEVLKRVCV